MLEQNRRWHPTKEQLYGHLPPITHPAFGWNQQRQQQQQKQQQQQQQPPPPSPRQGVSQTNLNAPYYVWTTTHGHTRNVNFRSLFEND